MPRRGENIYRRKDGRWEGRILRDHTANHKPLYTYIYGHSYKEVKEKMDVNRVMTANRLRGSSVLAERTSFTEFAESWLVGRKSKVKESTYAHYRRLIDRHIIPLLGELSVQKITDDVLLQYVEDLQRCGRVDHKGGLSAKTISDILILLKAILRYAEKSGCVICAHLEEHIIRKQRQAKQLSRS